MHLHYTTEHMLCSTFGGCHIIELEAVLARKRSISALSGCLKQTLFRGESSGWMESSYSCGKGKGRATLHQAHLLQGSV